MLLLCLIQSCMCYIPFFYRGCFVLLNKEPEKTELKILKSKTDVKFNL